MKRILAIVAILVILGVIVIVLGMKQGWFTAKTALSQLIDENPNIPTNPEKPKSFGSFSDDQIKLQFKNLFKNKFVRSSGTQRPIFYVTNEGQLRKVSDEFYTYAFSQLPGPQGVALQQTLTNKLENKTNDVEPYYFTVVEIGSMISPTEVGNLIK